jgi:hypothetical protein
MAHLNDVPLPSPTGECTAPRTSEDNLAFRLMDVLTDARHGLGIAERNMDLPAFRTLAAYCDEAIQDEGLALDDRYQVHGHYLCEGCMDAMTDVVVPAAQSPTGIEMALCAACQAQGGPNG